MLLFIGRIHLYRILRDQKTTFVFEIVFNLAAIIVSFSGNVNLLRPISAHYMNPVWSFYVFRPFRLFHRNPLIPRLSAIPPAVAEKSAEVSMLVSGSHGKSRRPFAFPLTQKFRDIPHGMSRNWYARRDSNPQPSEPESDALSIEPLAHFIDSLCIIPIFFIFVKGYAEKYFLVFRPPSAKTVVFPEYVWYNPRKC